MADGFGLGVEGFQAGEAARSMPSAERICVALDTRANDDGAFFHTRVGRPWMETVSISSGCPGAVSSAWAWAIDITGQLVICGFPKADCCYLD